MPLITTAEAAEILCVSKMTVGQYAKKGYITAYINGVTNQRHYEREEVEAFADSKYENIKRPKPPDQQVNVYCIICGQSERVNRYIQSFVCQKCKKKQKETSTRPCHDCGKSTTDFRCTKCNAQFKKKHNASCFNSVSEGDIYVY